MSQLDEWKDRFDDLAAGRADVDDQDIERLRGHVRDSWTLLSGRAAEAVAALFGRLARAETERDKARAQMADWQRSDDKWADYAMRLRSTLEFVRLDIDHPGIDAVIDAGLVGDMPEPLADLRERYPQDTVIAAVGWTPDGNTLSITGHLDNEGVAALSGLFK